MLEGETATAATMKMQHDSHKKCSVVEPLLPFSLVNK